MDRNPLHGKQFVLPREKNPRRVVIDEAQYAAILGVADEVGWQFHVALVLAHETGHRIGAIRKLRWSDVDLQDAKIRWRAENEKTGYEHVTPLSDEAVAVLEQARRTSPGIGDAPILAAPRDPTRHVSRNLVRDWWERAEALSGLDPVKGRGWHSLRRKFASDLMDRPLKVLSELGGWKRTQTIIDCYQHPDQEQLRDALVARRRVSSGTEQRE